jgi:isopenicillin-N epimerase
MNRRAALQTAVSLFGLPLSAAVTAAPAPLPEAALRNSSPEAYWKRIRDDQFLLPGWRCFMNNGSLGITPKPIVAAIATYLERAAALTQTPDLQEEDYPRWGYETLDKYRTELAQFFGCKKDELALMHNATEAMSTIAAGLDLKSGDEVLITDQEHPSGRGGWFLRQQRHGVVVREVKIAQPAKNEDELVDTVISAIGPRTKVLSFSGILTTTGLIMPVKRICAAARSKGVITVVDGAHMHGQIPVNMNDLGCDFMAGSPHKWMFAPAGCGLLYVREEMLDRLWPTVATDFFMRGGPDLKAAKYMMMGTNNRSIFIGLMAGLEFMKKLGPENIYSRIHHLSREVYRQAAKRSELTLLSSADDKLYGSLVTFQMKPDHYKKFAALCTQKKIWIVRAERMRVATHVHTRPQDIQLFFDTLDEAAKA